ncbi:UDP-N-acetylmuramate dehydrogenase [Rubeoparvulum massiliense]|uniref:UDP-N-acetylmuramate dehydrogenase n=1 Tax=Rubeoparvulum massiliense TaxID=1631346 RepID=UPI00065DC88D|nr:UDP-N-acetylmuramate dehydrogenase [Rubeoparvulum massiliense]
MLQNAIKELHEAKVGTIVCNEIMARYTTWKVGGPADLFLVIQDKAALQRTIEILHRHEIPWLVLGKGSNILVSDLGIRGAVIKLDRFNQLEIMDTRIQVGAGYSMVNLAITAGKAGLTGLEFAGGIPGTVGGACYMNAGAHGSNMAAVCEMVEVVTETGKILHLTNREMQFAYRTSILQEKPWIVTELHFQLQKGDRKEIAAALASYKDRRRKTQPLKEACAGSVFRNPEGDHAGRLIEAAGLKGFSLGDAQVSTIHANFIVNRGKASAADIEQLISHVQQEIKRQFGIQLETEVLRVGEHLTM